MPYIPHTYARPSYSLGGEMEFTLKNGEKIKGMLVGEDKTSHAFTLHLYDEDGSDCGEKVFPNKVLSERNTRFDLLKRDGPICPK